MSKCYGWQGTDGNGNPVYFLGCANGTPGWTGNSIYGGAYYYPSDDGQNITGHYDYGAKPGSITALNSQADVTAWQGSRTVLGSCSGCTVSNPKYDCVNGNCFDSNTYKTPGIYNSLSDCQAVCANGGACSSGKQCVDPTTFCPSGKVCIEQTEYDSIQGLISKINSEVC